MTPVIVTNDAVLLSFAEHVLAEAGIAVFVADRHVSIAEGSIGAFPRRLLVPAEDVGAARTALADAGLAMHLAAPS
jgi:hypothetical protein